MYKSRDISRVFNIVNQGSRPLALGASKLLPAVVFPLFFQPQENTGFSFHRAIGEPRNFVKSFSGVIVPCESIQSSHADDEFAENSGVSSLESVRPSLSFLPSWLHKIFPVLCWFVLVSVWLGAAAAPVFVLICLTVGALDELLVFLIIWLLGSVTKFPQLPSLTEALTTGVEAWFREFSIYYEPDSVKTSEGSRICTTSRSRRKTIYCYHPHGLFSIGAVLLAMDLIRRGEKIAFITSSHMRWFNPFIKMFMDMAGIEIVGASPQEVQAAMKRGDRSLILVPGGYEEAVLTQNGFERLFLEDRKGFVKYAMRYGYSLTPVYAYGENELYRCVGVASRFRMWLAQWKIPIVVFYGDNRIPLLPIQNERGLRIVVGREVFVDTVLNPSSDALHEAHAIYVEKLVEMYYRHNRDQDRPLEIV